MNCKCVPSNFIYICCFKLFIHLQELGKFMFSGWCVGSNNLCLFFSLSFPCFFLYHDTFPVCKYWLKKQNVSFHQFVMSIVCACNSLALLLWQILAMLMLGEIPEEKMLYWCNDLLKLFIITVMLHMLVSFKCWVV